MGWPLQAYNEEAAKLTRDVTRFITLYTLGGEARFAVERAGLQTPLIGDYFYFSKDHPFSVGICPMLREKFVRR